MTSVSGNELRDAERAFALVQPELEALRLDELAPMNVDVVTATSIVLGVADQILPFRDQMAQLPNFELRHVDRLVDYALATWYASVTHLPAPDPHAVTDLLAEVDLLRAKTEADLARAAELGLQAFTAISRRENRSSASALDGSVRVRRAWTLLDRAYAHCRRALAYLRFEEDDADSIAPSLRRNPGTPPPAATASVNASSHLAPPAAPAGDAPPQPRAAVARPTPPRRS